MLNFIKRNIPTLLFICAELVLYIFIMFINVSCFKALQWASILLCLVFAVLMTRKITWIKIALLSTVVADGFLVAPPSPIQVPGMTFFAITSMCYFIFLVLKEDPKTQKIHFITRVAIIVTALAITPIVLKEKTDYLSMISVFYFANLILNIVFSFFTFKSNKLLSIGLVLFILCDLFIGFAFLGDYLPIKEGGLIYSLINAPIDLSWLFYLPSQVVISLFAVHEF